MPVASVSSQTSRRNWQQTTQESVNVFAAFAVTVSMAMIIVMAVREFASVRLPFDAQDQAPFDVLTLVEEFEQCLVGRNKSRGLSFCFTFFRAGCQFELLRLSVMREVQCDLRRLNGDSVLCSAVQNVNRDACVLVRGMIVVVLSNVSFLFVVSIVVVAVWVNQLGMIFLVAQLDQVAAVRTMSWVSVSRVWILGRMLVVVRRHFAELFAV